MVYRGQSDDPNEMPPVMVDLLSSPPRYSEAYPRLSIGDAWRGWRNKNSDALWRNRFAHVVGVAAIDWPSPHEIVVQPHIPDLPYVGGTEESVTLQIEYKGSTQSNARPFIVCEGCAKHIDVIVYAEDIWRCKDCLRLRNRSTLIDPVVRISEELCAIERQISDGRPRNMRMARYDELTRRYTALTCDLRGRPQRSAAREYLARIDTEWLPRSSLVALRESRGE